MTEEKRNKPVSCPTHGTVYLWREDNKITCCINGCDFNIPARREADKEITTSVSIKREWR